MAAFDEKGVLRGLYHYPIKGMSAQPLDSVRLDAGKCFPADRIIALARADGSFDPTAPSVPLDKDNFFMLRRDERLASLETLFEPQSGQMTIRIKGRMALECNLSEDGGRRALADFVGTMFDLPPGKRPVFARAEPHRYTDVEHRLVSLINIDSVRDFAERIGVPVDPLRFRANIYFEGWPPFSEMELKEGTELSLAGTRLRVVDRTGRCAATEVNPRTAQRDLEVPKLLMRQYGHADMGIYAEVMTSGTVALGDTVLCQQGLR